MNTNDCSQFIEEFKSLARKNFDGEEDEHTKLYTLGRKLLKEGNFINRKPAEVDYATWDSIKFYLTESAQYDLNKDYISILGFVPVLLLRHEGELSKFNPDLTLKKQLEKMILDSFIASEYGELVDDINISKFMVKHDQLASAAPDNLVELMELIQGERDASAYWTLSDVKISEEHAALFYLPMLVRIKNSIPSNFYFTDIFEDDSLAAMPKDAIDTLWYYIGADSDDFEATLQYGKPEPYMEVLEDGETERDLANIELALDKLKYESENYEQGLLVKLIVEIYWPVKTGEIIPKDIIPTIRFSIAANDSANNEEVLRDTYNVHVPKFAGEEWRFILSKLMSLSYELGYTHITVLQSEQSNLIKAWQHHNEGSEVH